ncbi:MAG: HIT family protein, partial [Candidatus Nanohaloarchaea archaeon]
MPQQGQCPYCQLIDNPEQLLVVSETENFYAWLEIQPRARGHTQVVPKQHRESVLDFTPEEYDEAMTVVRKVIEKAEEGLGADGASVTMNVGEAAGQMLPHAYISVFPRFSEDENAGTPTGAIFPQ